MGSMPPKPQSLITFTYYSDLEPIAEFYEQVMRFDLVQDQGIAKIYRINGTAYLGIVDGAKGFLRAQEHSAVLITLVVDDVSAWHQYVASQGVADLSDIKFGTHCEHFFFKDPGGYAIEVQKFRDPKVHRMFQA
jgi:predicted enzyme related to lactoylglutathione lyase